MRLLKAIITSSVAMSLLSACIATKQPSDSTTLGTYRFAYRIENRESVRLVQVFDDGKKTYLQFTSAGNQPIVIADAGDPRPLDFTAQGPYLVVPGVYDRLTVSVAGQSTLVTNDSASARPTRSVESTPSAPRVETQSVPVLGADQRTERLPTGAGTLSTRIRDLKAALEQAHAEGRATDVQVRSDNAIAKVVIRFDKDSSAVHVDDALLRALGGAAQAATRVVLRGYSDAFTSTPAMSELALARAVSVKKLLVAQGISPQRIRIFYRGAGGFVTDNGTDAGKAINRRVEIQMTRS